MCENTATEKGGSMKAVIGVVVTAILVFGAVAVDASDWKELKRESKRLKIDETAAEALDRLFSEDATAKDLYDKAYGWAVFDNLKIALGVSGGGGNGVAVEMASAERTYMRMGTVGVGIGLGGNKYQVVFLFQDEATYRQFVDQGWQADAGATAAAGKDSAEGKTNFSNGLAIYQLTEKGLMLHADIAGTKYGKNEALTE
jgi:lipid-binding SYLF domain-containing protein